MTVTYIPGLTVVTPKDTQTMSLYTTPDFFSTALITIDTQCDTLDGQPFEITGTSAILPQMRALLDAARSLQLPIIHIVRIHKSDGSNVDMCRRDLIEQGANLVLEGSPGCEIARELLPEPRVKLNADLLLEGGIQGITANEVIIYKPRWGAFYQTRLEEHLKRLGVSTLIFTGCNFPNCPRTSIYEASERDYRIVFVEDAVSGLYERGRKEMENIGVKILNTQETIASLRAAWRRD